MLRDIFSRIANIKATDYLTSSEGVGVEKSGLYKFTLITTMVVVVVLYAGTPIPFFTPGK